MNPSPEDNSRRWAFRMAAIEFFFWIAFASTAYLTVYLNHLGYSASQVSIINTLLSAVAVISGPIMGTLADKMRSTRKALVIILIAYGILYALIPLVARAKIFGLSMALVFLFVSRVFQGPSISLLEPTVINGCDSTGVFYGDIRVYGTISYVVMSFFLGLVMTGDNSGWSFPLLTLLLAPCVFYLIVSKNAYKNEAARGKKTALKDLPYGRLFKNPYYIAYLVFSLVERIPFFCIEIFQPYLIESVGGNMGYIGLIHAYRALFEVPMLLMSRKIQSIMSYRTMVILTAILYAIQSILYVFTKSFGMMIVFTTFSGLASGFNVLGVYRYVLMLTPRELQGTGQTLVSATQSAAGIIAGLIGAALIATMGVKELYLVIGLLLTVTTLLFVLSQIILEKVFNKPFVDYSKER